MTKTVPSDEDLINFVTKSSYFEEDDAYCGDLRFTTRQNGNVAEGVPGGEDILLARKLTQQLLDKFSNIAVDVEIVDEWVDINITRIM